jgi:hypothetical protein
LAVGVASSSAAKPQTISVLEVDTFFAGTGGLNTPFHTWPPAPGEGITFSGTVYSWAGTKRGAPIGHARAICIVTSGTNGICSGAISLPSGSIVLLGPEEFSGNSTTEDIPIVGGTGAYVGARGYMHSTSIGHTSASADVIHITG